MDGGVFTVTVTVLLVTLAPVAVVETNTLYAPALLEVLEAISKLADVLPRRVEVTRPMVLYHW